MRAREFVHAVIYAPAAIGCHCNERTSWGLVHGGYPHAVQAAWRGRR